MKKLIIGLLAESKSGKDWLSKILIDNLDKQFYKLDGLIKAADLIKELCETKYPNSFSIKDWEALGDEYREEYVEELGKTRRELLQDTGDDLLKNNPDYVYLYLNAAIKESGSELVLIPDLRNQRECEAVKDAGGIIVKVTRPLKERYPEEWEDYLKSINNSPLFSRDGFLDYINSNLPGLQKKLSHKTETSIEEVNESIITFNFYNSKNSGSDRRLKSLIRKLRAI